MPRFGCRARFSVTDNRTSQDLSEQSHFWDTIRGMKGPVHPVAYTLLISSLLVSFCMITGCKPETIWSAESRSPDGLWIASYQTNKFSGPGNNSVETLVYLRRTSGNKEPIQILLFEHDQNARFNTINLRMKWLSPSHLEVTFNNSPTIDFQAIKCAGIDISVQDFSGDPRYAPE